MNGLADTLNTSLEKGIKGDDDDVLERKNVYGSNTYPRKKPRSFWVYVLYLISSSHCVGNWLLIYIFVL